MKLLTLDDLKNLNPHALIACGHALDGPSELNMMNTGRILYWVAYRGGTHDWAIYCMFDDEVADKTGWVNNDFVHDNGEKVTDEKNIKFLVPCTDEAFNMYRY